MERRDIDRVALTVPEVAEALGVGLSSAYQLIHREDFPSIPIGRSVRIRRAKQAEWVERQAGGGLQ